MNLQQEINNTNELIAIIDKRLVEAKKESDKKERISLLKSSDKEARIDYYIAFSTVDKLMDLKLLLLKDINIKLKS
ncbi:hypothetical protein AAK964_08555 [Tissierella praeacuta]|uniref:hypothetical protein n=1 Tax=Tissierella praeacuta TaxID=43131 RepID=UPI003512E1DE